MILFWSILFYSNSIFAVFSILYLIYEKIKKKEGFKGIFMLVFSLFIMFFSQDRLCNLILEEIITDLKSGKLVLEKNQILTNSNIYNLEVSSQRHNYSEKTYAVTLLPSKDDLIIKQDYSNNRFWVFYTKYYYSKHHAIGYVK